MADRNFCTANFFCVIAAPELFMNRAHQKLLWQALVPLHKMVDVTSELQVANARLLEGR
jgi:ferredoxin